MKRRFAMLAWVAASTLTASFAWADAKDTVTTQQQLITGLLKSGGESNEVKIKAAFDDLLDYESLAKRSLASHWEELTPAQRVEFTEVLQQLVQRAYRKSMAQILDYDVAYIGESAVEGGTLVKTKATHRTNKRADPLRIDYAMHEIDGEWRVFDIVTSGSSLVNNYKNQFRRVIKKKGFSGLFDILKKKLAAS